jgi:alpha-glucosidase (family GH31 glycosyl hydrolase)
MLSGGQEIVVSADVHQMPIFVREGSPVAVGDLNREWTDAVNIAARKPDLKALESAAVR